MSKTLATQTLSKLPADPKSVRYQIAGLIAAIATSFVVAVAIITLPRIATARAIDSIRSSVQGKVMHTRVFQVGHGNETFLAERWTDGARFRWEGLGGYTNISDGRVTLSLHPQDKVAKISKDEGYKYAPSGFDIDSILRDMTKYENLSAVTIETLTVDGVDTLVAKFAGKTANYRIYCDTKTRLPKLMEIVPTSPWHPDKQTTVLRFDYLDGAGGLFSTKVPAGYKVIDLRKGFDSYVQKPIFEVASPRFRLFSVDVNSKGEVFAICASEREFEIDLNVNGPYAGPVSLKTMVAGQQPTIDSLPVHVLTWVTKMPVKDDLSLTVRIPGKEPIGRTVRINHINGIPTYYSFALQAIKHREDVPLDDLHKALDGIIKLPEARVGGIVINATFDPSSSDLSGNVRNTSGSVIKELALLYRILDAGPWASVKRVRIGTIGVNETVDFSDRLRERRSGGPIPVLDVQFESIYDPTKRITYSPYRRGTKG